MKDSSKALLPFPGDGGSEPVLSGRLAFARALFVCATTPALLASILLAALVFFLNPGLAMGTDSILGIAGRFGVLLVPLSFGFHMAIPSLRSGVRSFRPLPWSLTGVLGLAAIGSGFNASRFAYFLPPGINDRLIKAALWVSAAALAAFYTALLHSLHSRRYGPRSRALFVLLCAGSLIAMFERRGSYVAPGSRPAAVMDLSAPKGVQAVVVVLPGVSLDLVLPLAEQGALPFLSSILHEGSGGRLAGPLPARRATAWATLATGKLPFRHGILGDKGWVLAARPSALELRLLPSEMQLPLGFFGFTGTSVLSDRSLLALPAWEVLTRAGLEVAAIDLLFGPSPARGCLAVGGGFSFSAGGSCCAAAGGEDRASLGGDVTPELRQSLGLPTLHAALVGDSARQAAAARIMGSCSALDVLFVRLPGIEEAALSSFGGFAATQFDGSRARVNREAAARLSVYASQVDRLLAGLWVAGEQTDRVLLVVSPYGLSPSSRWQRFWGEVSRQPAVGAANGVNEDGCFFLLGAGIRPGVESRNARLVDVAPTVFYALGLPVARDFDGRVLTEVFTPEFLARRPLSFVPTFETVRFREAHSAR